MGFKEEKAELRRRLRREDAPTAEASAAACRAILELPEYKEAKTVFCFVGAGAEAMIALEAKEQKYSVERHAKRLPHILDSWDKILTILEEELPSSQEIARILKVLNISEKPLALGDDREGMRLTFQATKDIRDKYVLSRLVWDLGLMDEMCAQL